MMLQRALGEPGHRRDPGECRFPVTALEQTRDCRVADCRARLEALGLLFSDFFHCAHLSNDFNVRKVPG